MRTLKLDRRMIGWLIAGLLILAALTRVFWTQYRDLSHYTYSNLASGTTTVGTIWEGIEVAQELPCQPGDVGVAVQFATYARSNAGDVTVRIVGEATGTVYCETTRPASDFADNAFTDFTYESAPAPEDEKLKLTVTSTSPLGEGLTIWTTEQDAIAGCDLTFDGQTVSGDLSINRISPSVRYRFSWVIYALVILAVAAFMGLAFRKGVKPETLYLVLALGLGLAYMFTMTPIAIPDEPNHYQSSFRLSNVLCFQWGNLGQGDAQYFDYTSFAGHHNVGSAYDRFLSGLFLPGQPQGLVDIPDPSGIIYPLMLLPQALGITLGRLLGLNMLLTFYLGRFCNLLFYSLCVYFAIRRTSRFKLLFCIVGLMPMALHQAASYSYDGFINGMLLLFVALALRAIDGEGPITMRELAPVALVGILICPAKVVYAPVLLLLLLIPRRRFRDSRRFFLTLAAVAALGALAMLLIQLPSIRYMASSAGAGTGSATDNWEGSRNYTISFILQNPLETCRIFLRSLKWRGWDWIMESIGRVFAGYSFLIEDRPIMLYLFLLFVCTFRYEEDRRLPTCLERTFFGVIPAAFILASMLSMFLAWTSDTSPIINGIQGRYFIPAVPLLLMCLSNPLATLHKSAEKALPLLAALLNIEVIYQVVFKTMNF